MISKHVRLAAMLALFYSAALAQDMPTHLRGTITAVDGTKLTLGGADGSTAIVRLAPNAEIEAVTKASLVDVTPGTLVGVANSGPNGLQDALEVHILPLAMRGKAGAKEGQSPWDLGRRSRMTVGIAGAKAESYDGQNLTVTFNGDEATIQVRPNTPVVRLQAGGRADLKTGAAIFVRDGERQPDGSVLTESVVVGRGVKPPM